MIGVITMIIVISITEHLVRDRLLYIGTAGYALAQERSIVPNLHQQRSAGLFAGLRLEAVFFCRTVDDIHPALPYGP